MKLILFVGLGGFLGAISRYEITLICNKYINTIIPIGTLLVNILGGLLIGFIMELSTNTNYISPNLKVFLTTGFMGGLTTFSTFSYESVVLFNQEKYSSAIINILSNGTLSILAVFIGMYLCKFIFSKI